MFAGSQTGNSWLVPTTGIVDRESPGRGWHRSAGLTLSSGCVDQKVPGLRAAKEMSSRGRCRGAVVGSAKRKRISYIKFRAQAAPAAPIENHFATWLFHSSNAIDIGHLISSLIVGSLLPALIARNSESAPAILVGLVNLGMAVAACILVAAKPIDVRSKLREPGGFRYSARRASIGSARAARRAGTQDARRTTRIRSSGTRSSIAGSKKPVRKRLWVRSRDANRERKRPPRHPASAMRAPRRSTREAI